MFLGLDASTQSCSALIIDPTSGAIIAEESVNFGKELPEFNAPQGFIPRSNDGEVHSDPLMWLDAIDLLFQKLGKSVDLRQIDAISGAGQQHGSVYLNEHWFERIKKLSPTRTLSEQLGLALARSTAPIWMDTSTRQECAEITHSMGGADAVVQRSGSQAIERFTGPQIRRFFKTDPEAYQRTERIHLVSSFLASVLSGSDAPIDYGDGAGMNLLNLASHQWDSALLDATAPDLHHRLPAVQPSQTILGPISSYFVERYGFSPQTQVITFTGDNPSSLIGMGASRPGKVVISLGTSDTIFAALPHLVTDPNGFGHVFGNPAGGFMALQCFLNGSLAREAIRDQHGLDWKDFSAALKDTPIGNNGCSMLPFFGPEISPRRNASGPIRFGGDTSFQSAENPLADVRACVEGQFLNMKIQSNWMGLSTDTLYLTGGAAANEAIAQVAADVFQARVERLQITSSVALGAALRAAAMTGHAIQSLQDSFCQSNRALRISPNKAAAPVYREALKAFKINLKT